jgi:phosphatidylserine decarboxylase
MKILEILKNVRKIKREHLSLHPEGYTLTKNLLVYLIILNGILYFLEINDTIYICFNIFCIGLFLVVLYFFRNPERMVFPDENAIYAPADGKIVVIEQTIEHEYFNEPRMQISIFMSPLDVHVNRVPVSGKIKYFKYHEGNYTVAWHPKSSILNERTSVVLQTSTGQEVLLRQIAGALARRIICYAKEGSSMQQGQDLGFIKFGSRVDILLPLNSKIKVNIGEHVRGNETVIANI